MEKTLNIEYPAEQIKNISTLIEQDINKLAENKQQVKERQEMLEDIFNNNPTYKSHLETSKEAAIITKKTKAEVLKTPQAAKLNQEIKDLKAEGKLDKDSLSDLLAQYRQLTGATEFETSDGTMYLISANYQLKLF